jgi:PAS domain S-box-containing protein
MRNPSVMSILIGLVACCIPPYAIRLSRAFGTQRVGWTLFATFTLLAVLQVLREWHPRLGIEPDLTIDLLNLLIPVLLLIGMVHIDLFFRERLQLEQGEKRLRESLEAKVLERTADLDKANDELQREISLRKQGEAELKKSKEQYRFLFDENPQPMWIYDRLTFKFLAFNAAALRYYGYTSAEFREMTAKDLCQGADAEAFAADSAKPVNSIQPRAIRRHVKKDGSVIEVESAALDLTYSECSARLVLVSDMSAQKLLQKQTLQSQKMAVTTQLAGGVADNFSRLVNAIESDASVLALKCQDPAAAAPLRRIAATAACAAGLTRQLLALVRRHPMRAQSLDLNKLIENQNGTLSRLAGDKITVEKLCWAGLPSVSADPELVEAVVHQLVRNARDAMPNGGTLTLCTAPVLVDEARARAHEEARPGAFVCLTVADTGCGMTPEVQARLFEPFFTTKDPAKATGLGLATVHGLVKQHSGWIEVTTHEGSGSKFHIFFPCIAGSPARG